MEAGESTEARASADQGGVGHHAQGRSPAEDSCDDPSEVVDGAVDNDGIGGDEGGTTFAAAKQGRASGVPNWDASEAVAVVWACLAVGGVGKRCAVGASQKDQKGLRPVRQ